MLPLILPGLVINDCFIGSVHAESRRQCRSCNAIRNDYRSHAACTSFLRASVRAALKSIGHASRLDASGTERSTIVSEA